MSSKTTEKEPKEEPKKTPPAKPSHDCIICPPKEECKHTVSLHRTIVPLVRGNAGVEDLFKKINEVVEWLVENDIQLAPDGRKLPKHPK